MDQLAYEQKDTFAPGDLDTVINQLVFRSHGYLEHFVEDTDLFVRVVGEILCRACTGPLNCY